MAVKVLKSRVEKGVAAFVVLLIAAAIAIPVYISTIDRDQQDGTDGNSESVTIQVRQTHSTMGRSVYRSNGALQFQNGHFTVNGTTTRLLSGAMHYFRTVPKDWTDRLQKLKACGLNTVETYVPWNLHEEYPNEFNFDGILNVREFLQKAHALGLYVIFRPGPYICSEWDFGGLPAWLLHDPDMKVRSNYPGYLEAVERYFNKLLPLIADLQYSRGGPIIAFQVENEYGSFSSNVEHLKAIKNQFVKHGLNELFLTSDNPWGVTNAPFYTEALPTANFKDIKDGRQIFDQIHKWSPEFPLMVTEFWTGWFDHWTSKHEGLPVSEYSHYLEEILKAGASVNFYMFHGGTNFGFMNGANQETTYKPDVTSYDYDALLTEKGDITPKYLKTRELLLKYVYKPQGIQSLPDIPGNAKQRSYGKITMADVLHIPFVELLKKVQSEKLESPVPMEMLNTYHGLAGQNFGYILYSREIPGDSAQLVFANPPADRAQIFVNGQLVETLGWKTEALKANLRIGNTTNSPVRLDILVENNGRVNYGTEASNVFNKQRTGINGEATVDGKLLKNVTAFQLDFKQNFTQSTGWMKASGSNNPKIPALFKATLNIQGTPEDTFVFMKGWGKGIVMVNGLNLGRYWNQGPQQTLYVPSPVLKSGDNQVIWFEVETQGEAVIFTDTPILDVNDQSTIKLD